MSASGESDSRSKTEQADEVTLLVEVLGSRAEGVIDFQAGSSDEDLLYALEEALPMLHTLKSELEAST